MKLAGYVMGRGGGGAHEREDVVLRDSPVWSCTGNVVELQTVLCDQAAHRRGRKSLPQGLRLGRVKGKGAQGRGGG